MQTKTEDSFLMADFIMNLVLDDVGLQCSATKENQHRYAIENTLAISKAIAGLKVSINCKNFTKFPMLPRLTAFNRKMEPL